MGKAKTPAPPDLAGAAKETAAGDLAMANYATKANRIDQISPWGELRYQYAPQYDAEGKETGGGWTQTETLNPQAQAALDEELALNRKYGEVANIGFDKARNIFENPQLDVSGLPARAINVGQTAQDALMSRANPMFAQQEESTRARLANQGITLGSEAYQREMDQQAQARNDFMMQAALQGINLDQANRTAALQEQAYLQDRPLNLVSALRSGGQTSSPQFQQFAQQATTRGPDMLTATQGQYNAQLDATNAQNQASSGLMSGLLGVGLGIGGLGVSSGGTLLGNFLKR